MRNGKNEYTERKKRSGIPFNVSLHDMKGLILSIFISVAALENGCALFIDKETLYLRSAQDRDSQQEVRDHLGRPLVVESTKTGETVWVYHIREAEKGGNNIWTITGSWCDEYVLTFDKQGVLRHWTHKSEKHREERWPSYCVRDGIRLSP